MSKYQLCKSKLHRPLEKWNLNFHFRGIEHKFEIAVHFYIDMVYLKAVKYIFNSRMRDRNNMKEA